MTLVDAMCQLLAGSGVGFYSTTEVLPADETRITVATMPPEGDLAVTVTTYPGGPPPDARNTWEYPRMQVRVRATDPLDALALDRQAFIVLQAPGPQQLPGGSWFLQDCYALQSEPQPLGQDANGRSEFVRNYQLTAEPVT